ncbi:MAG: hypothetical protein H6686_05560 [Fibrobacteria bacterium]|nr:hypothetical protein [Fibrobacteria bacterium]
METNIRHLRIEPPSDHDGWVFRTVLASEEADPRSKVGAPRLVGDPLLPPGISLDAAFYHDPCLGTPSFPARLTLLLRTADEIFDTLSIPVPSDAIAPVLEEASRLASPSRSEESKTALRLELQSVGQTPAMAWLERIWCSAGCQGWWEVPRTDESTNDSPSCDGLAYLHPELIWLPGEEHILHLRVVLPTAKDSAAPPSDQASVERISVDLDVRTLQRENP